MNEFSDFLSRIRTYSFDKWTLRSPQITPYDLASWGFICIEEDIFECSMCEQRIDASHLPFPSEFDSENEIISTRLLLQNFFGCMKEVHRDECEYK